MQEPATVRLMKMHKGLEWAHHDTSEYDANPDNDNDDIEHSVGVWDLLDSVVDPRTVTIM